MWSHAVVGAGSRQCGAARLQQCGTAAARPVHGSDVPIATRSAMRTCSSRRLNFAPGTRLILAGTIQFASCIQAARQQLATDFPYITVPQVGQKRSAQSTAFMTLRQTGREGESSARRSSSVWLPLSMQLLQFQSGSGCRGWPASINKLRLPAWPPQPSPPVRPCTPFVCLPRRARCPRERCWAARRPRLQKSATRLCLWRTGGSIWRRS
jgi:hypothetical protein